MKTFLLFFFLSFFLMTIGAQETNVFDAEFVRIKDGDTFVAKVLLPTDWMTYDYEEVEVDCRLWRCDTYEMDDEENAEIALAGKYFSDAKLTRAFNLKIKYRGKDFFGRWLVTVYLEDKTLCSMLELKKYLTGKYKNAPENHRIKTKKTD